MWGISTLVAIYPVMTSIRARAADTADYGSIPASLDSSSSSSAHIETPVEAESRILYGEQALSRAIPFQVGLGTSRRGFLCGGSIIGKQWVLTAAHCVPGVGNGADLRRLVVRAGTEIREDGGSLHRVAGGERHPLYQDTEDDWDIAVLYVVPPFELDESRAIVQLPEPGDGIPFGQTVQVSGWGLERAGGQQLAFILKRTNLTVVSHSMCKVLYGLTSITRRMFCAGSLAGRDACEGDSGGPAVVLGKPPVQYGIVSFGKSCGRVGHPGVYTNLAERDIRDYITTVSGI